MSSAARLRVLIDDIRSFRDGRPAMVARSSTAGVALLESLSDRRVDELWLDHDLVGEDTIWPVVEWLITAPRDVALVVVHASRSRPAHRMRKALRDAGYEVERSYDLRIWVHARTEMLSDPNPKMQSRGGSA